MSGVCISCVFCALKASFGIIIVLAERADERSCRGNRLLSSLSDKMIGYGLGRSRASVGQVWAGARRAQRSL